MFYIIDFISILISLFIGSFLLCRYMEEIDEFINKWALRFYKFARRGKE